MAYRKYKLGDLVEQYDEINQNGEFTEIEDLQGINSNKYFQECKSNKNNINLLRYRICRHGMFSYNRATSRNGEKISIALRTGDDCIVSPSYYCFRVKDEEVLCPEYLDIWFKRPVFDKYARFNSWGSATEFFTFDDFCATEIMLPPLPEQRKIVHDHQVITDRIELLRKMNENLEEQAELLFSDFMSSSNGKEGVFSDVIKIMGGGTPSTAVNEYWNGDIPFFTPGDINGSFCFSTNKTLTDKGLANCSSKKYPIKTTFITCRGTVGKVALAGVPMAMNQTCYALTGKGDYPNYFVYEFVKYFVNSIKRKANGGVFDAITTKDFETEKVDVPTEGQALDFEKDVKPIFAVIFNNQREMFTLEHIRTLTMTSMIQKGA